LLRPSLVTASSAGLFSSSTPRTRC